MLFGLMRGFIRALASVLAWLLAGWVAFHYGAEVAAWLSDDGPRETTDLLGGYARFVASPVVVGVTGWLVRKMVSSVGLSGVDRLLGPGAGLQHAARSSRTSCCCWQPSPICRANPEWKRSSWYATCCCRARSGFHAGCRNGPCRNWTWQRRSAGDNARLHPLPLPLEESGAPQGLRVPCSFAESKPE